MKKIFTVCLLFFLLSKISFGSISDTIPNAGFERWLQGPWFDYPESWISNNGSLLPIGVVYDSVGHSGNWAVKLQNNGAIKPIFYTGFKLNTRPFNLGGYLKKNIQGADSVLIIVHLYLNNSLVDSGYHVEYSGNTFGYVPFVFSISQNLAIADSCDIYFTGGGNYQSEISIDDLEFDFSSGLNHLNKYPLNVYPNPCSDKIFLQCGFPFPDGNISVEAYDITGKMEFLKPENTVFIEKYSYLSEYNCVYNTSHLNMGTWIVVVRRANFLYSTVIIKN